MTEKIRYRLVFNRAQRLNKRGEGLIQVEASQGKRRRYFSTHTYVLPANWSNGWITGTDNDNDRNFALRRFVWEIEQVELEFMKKGTDVTLPLLADAVRTHVSPSAKLRDFGMTIINESERKEMTKANYVTLFNDIDRFRMGTLLTDIDYAWVTAYDKYLRDLGVAHNTRVMREKLLRAIINEAKKRDLISIDPFGRFRMQQLVSKKGFVTLEQLHKLEKLRVQGKDEIVRDLFLVGCYTGLRFSDIKSLRSDHIKDGWIIKKMVKTGYIVEIPIVELFKGNMIQIIDKYGGDIGNLTKQTKDNAYVNKVLREMLDKVGVDGKVTFHSSRHTFATLLGQRGVDITVIQKLLGHQKLTTTQIYKETDRRSIVNGLKKGK